MTVSVAPSYNFGWLFTFSTLSILFHFLPISRVAHNALYSGNLIALVGFTAIIITDPTGFYDLYNPTFESILGVQISLNAWNALLWFAHLLPVYAFYKVYSFGDPTYWILIYLLVAGPWILTLYPTGSNQEYL